MSVAAAISYAQPRPARRLHDRHQPDRRGAAVRRAQRVDAVARGDHLLRRLDLGQQHELHAVRHDPVEVGESVRALVDAHHPLGAVEIDHAQRVAHQHPGRVLLGRRHRVLEIENHSVGLVQTGVDHELGLVARQVEPRAAQPFALAAAGGVVTRGRQPGAGAVGPGTLHGRLEPRVENERQGPLVVHLDRRVRDTESGAARLETPADVRPIKRLNLALQIDRDPAGVANVDADPAVGPDLLAAAARLPTSGHGSTSFRTAISAPARPWRATVQ